MVTVSGFPQQCTATMRVASCLTRMWLCVDFSSILHLLGQHSVRLAREAGCGAKLKQRLCHKRLYSACAGQEAQGGEALAGEPGEPAAVRKLCLGTASSASDSAPQRLTGWLAQEHQGLGFWVETLECSRVRETARAAANAAPAL